MAAMASFVPPTPDRPLTVTPGEGRNGQGVTIVAGELDAATAPELLRYLEPAARNGYEGLVLDLSQLQFMDSSGVQVIVSVAAAVEERGEKLVVQGAQRIVLRVLEITGVAEHLDLRPAAEDDSPPA